jgi:hypothetical protein
MGQQVETGLAVHGVNTVTGPPGVVLPRRWSDVERSNRTGDSGTAPGSPS